MKIRNNTVTTPVKNATAPAVPGDRTNPETPAVENTDTPAVESDSDETASGDHSSLDLEDLGGSSSVEAPKVKGNVTTSIGDPHETTGDGMKFDNMEVGDFIKMRSQAGDFELQTRQEPWEKNAQATVNTLAGIKVNSQGDKVVFDAKSGQMTFNGKPVTVEEGKPFEIPGGGTIEKQGEQYVVTSAAGDKVSLLDRGSYLDLKAEAGPERRDGDITGSLGALDSDTDFKNDLVGRNGEQMDDIAKFIEDWKAQPGESMFGDAIPADPNAPVEEPKGEGKPEDTLLTKLKELIAMLEGKKTEAPKDEKPTEEQQAGEPADEEAPAADAPEADKKDKKTQAGGLSPEVLALLTEILAELEKEQEVPQAA